MKKYLYRLFILTQMVVCFPLVLMLGLFSVDVLQAALGVWKTELYRIEDDIAIEVDYQMIVEMGKEAIAGKRIT